MAKLNILKFGSDVLREKAQPVEEITDEIRQLSRDMLETMYSFDGVGLAAPQIGVSKQLIVFDVSPNDPDAKPIVMINPEIVEREGELDAEEGCLSVPEVRGGVKRAKKIVVEAMDLDGNKLRVEAEDLLARVLQHEIDHLNGVIIVDHMSHIKRQMIKKQLKKLEDESKTRDA